MCSRVLLLSSPENFTNSGVLNPVGYAGRSNRWWYGFRYDEGVLDKLIPSLSYNMSAISSLNLLKDADGKTSAPCVALKGDGSTYWLFGHI